MAETLKILDRPVAVEGPADQYTIKNLGPDTAYYGGPNVSMSDTALAAGSQVTVAPTVWMVSAGQSRVTVAAVAQGSSGSSAGAVAITGPVLPSLQASTEYVWTKTDGNGNLLDIVSFKTDPSGNVPVGVS